MRLKKCVKIDDIFKLRACYFAANRGSPEIVRESEEATTEDGSDVSKYAAIAYDFSWRPEKILAEHKSK